MLTKKDMEDWVIKARFIFQDMRGNAPEFSTGREQLRQLLCREEGYPDVFRGWLVEKGIISDDLVPDRLRPR